MLEGELCPTQKETDIVFLTFELDSDVLGTATQSFGIPIIPAPIPPTKPDLSESKKTLQIDGIEINSYGLMQLNFNKPIIELAFKETPSRRLDTTLKGRAL